MINIFIMYLAFAVFLGFTPLAIFSRQWFPAILQGTCIVAVVVGSWRILTTRRVSFDNRIGLAFLAYILTTTATNLVWFLLNKSSFAN